MLLNVILFSAMTLSGGHMPDGGSTSDTVRLKEVVVSSKLKRYSAGLSISAIPQAEIKQSRGLLLSEMLSGQSNIVVSTYNPGGTSNVSLRGLSSAHTAVLWNGINLQNNMNAGVSFGNIPAFFVDQVVVQQGGNGSLFGSGAIGGVIHLDNTLSFNEGHSGELFQSIGSYGQTYSAAKYTYSGARTAISSRVFYTEAQNNYKFRNYTSIGKPIVHQTSANYRKAGLMETAAFTISPNDKLVVSLWGQDGYNRFPPQMSSSSSRQYDYSSFVRATAQWQATRKRVDFNVKSAFFNDWQAFRNPDNFERSNHHTTYAQLEGEAIARIAPNHNIEGGIIAGFDRASSTNYKKVKERIRPAATLGYRYSHPLGKWDAFASIREELINKETSPVTWSVGSQVRLVRGLYLRANVSRNYRIPSFNDLYWGNGWGNPDLKPEKGYGGEIGLSYIYMHSGMLVSAKAAFFNNNVSNWISWQPNDNGGWSPQNYDKVWSRGVESSITIKKRIGKNTIGADLGGSITYTTFDKAALKAIEGKQLPYVPKYRANGTLFYEHGTFRIRYAHSYTSSRTYSTSSYTIATSNDKMKAFQLGSLSLEKGIALGKAYELRGFARADNIWNEEYEMMRSYGMPLRTFQLGMVLSIGKE